MFENQLKSLADTLKKNPGILGKRKKYRNAAALISLCYLDGQWQFIFQRRQKDIAQGGEISFPGGKFDNDKDSNFKETAVRETAEEMGIRQEQIRIIGQLDTLVAAMGTTIDPFIGILEIRNLDGFKPDPNEVEEVFAIPVEFFQENEPEQYKVRLLIQPEIVSESGEKEILLPATELGLPDRYSSPWAGRSYPIYVFKTDKGPIWGITAELIVEFLELLK